MEAETIVAQFSEAAEAYAAGGVMNVLTIIAGFFGLYLWCKWLDKSERERDVLYAKQLAAEFKEILSDGKE